MIKNNYITLYRTLTLLGIASFFVGCGTTQKSRLYVLNSPLAPEAQSHTTENTPIIMISPIEIPAYLDRPTIVTQASENEMAFSEFHRWACPIEKNLQQIVVQNLSSLLKTDHIISDTRSITPDYRIKISIGSLTGTLGKTATLQAQWSLYAEDDNKMIVTKNFHSSIALTGDETIDYVAAQSTLISTLSHTISETIQSQKNL